MKIVPLAVAVALAASLLATPAQAGYIYLGAFGGATFPEQADVNSTILTTTLRGHDDFDPGFVVGGAVGYRFDFGLRLEGEVAYRRNHYDVHNGLSTSGH